MVTRVLPAPGAHRSAFFPGMSTVLRAATKWGSSEGGMAPNSTRRGTTWLMTSRPPPSWLLSADAAGREVGGRWAVGGAAGGQLPWQDRGSCGAPRRPQLTRPDPIWGPASRLPLTQRPGAIRECQHLAAAKFAAHILVERGHELFAGRRARHRGCSAIWDRHGGNIKTWAQTAGGLEPGRSQLRGGPVIGVRASPAPGGRSDHSASHNAFASRPGKGLTGEAGRVDNQIMDYASIVDGLGGGMKSRLSALEQLHVRPRGQPGSARPPAG